MKKLLIASAALAMVAGTAQAQSSVTVYGNLDLSYTSIENENTVANGTTTKDKIKNTGNGDGALSTSVIGFRGVEDLGGGLKANFQVEYDLVDAGVGANGNTSAGATADAAASTNGATSGFGARQSWAGLSSANGEVRLGRQAQLVHGTVAAGLAGAGNNIAGSIYSAGMAAAENDASIRPQNVFLNRAITYISPNINGLTFGVQSSNQTVTEGTTVTYSKETGYSLAYTLGKLNIGAGTAITKLDNATNTEKQTQRALSASYDLGVAKVFALNTQRKVANIDTGALASDTKATELGAQFPMGKTTLWASAFEGSRDGSSTSALATGNADVSGYQVGAKYDFSKRTTAYAIYGTQKISGTGATDNDLRAESTAYAIGVKHSF
jgi:predicted porin